MLNKLNYDTQNFTDVQGLKSLEYAAKKDPKLAQAEVCQQFQSYFMQLTFKSMNDANKALTGEGLFSSDQMDFYSQMYNQQLMLQLGKQDLGFGKMIAENLAARDQANTQSRAPLNSPAAVIKAAGVTQQPLKVMPIVAKKLPTITAPQHFVQTLWQHAKTAAKQIGLDPRILVAQAALETDWGRKIIPEKHGSSHNLFNIKADASWAHNRVGAKTIEETDGILTQKHSQFRAYDSFKASIDDYVKFLTNNKRYKHAIAQAHDNNGFLNALQAAGFATDHQYADKIRGILNNSHFNALISSVIKNI